MVALEQLRPRAISERAGALSRSDEIGEENRGEHAILDARRAYAREKLLGLVDDVVGLPERHVRIAWKLDESRAGDVRGDVAALFDARIAVADAVDDECRRLHHRQGVADVGLRVHQHEVTRRAWTRRRARPRHPPPRQRLVGTRRHAAEVGLDAPLAFDRGGVAASFLRRLGPRVVAVGPHPLRIGSVEHERAYALRIRRREQDRERSALRIAEQGRTVTAGGIHGTHIVHPGLQVRQPDSAIRETGATLVEANQPRKGPESLEQPCRRRVLPVIIEMRYESGNEDEVERPLARDLIGDVDVAALRVPDRRFHSADSSGPVSGRSAETAPGTLPYYST